MKPSPLQIQRKRVLYLVRHGQFDGEAVPDDGLEGGLTALGRRQARLTARRLSQLPISAVVHSDLRRAVETAAIIAEALPSVSVTASKLLREGLPGVPADIPAGFESYFAQYPRERIQKERARAERSFKHFFRLPRGGDQHIVLVGHGNVIRYLLCRVLDVPTGAWGHMDLRQCSVSEVVLQRGWRRVTRFGDVGHLPETLWTYF